MLTPRKPTITPPFAVAAEVIDGRLKLPRATTSQRLSGVACSQLDAITISETSRRGSKPVWAMNFLKVSSSTCMWESTNWPNKEFLVWVTCSPATTLASGITKRSRAGLVAANAVNWTAKIGTKRLRDFIMKTSLYTTSLTCRKFGEVSLQRDLVHYLDPIRVQAYHFAWVIRQQADGVQSKIG